MDNSAPAIAAGEHTQPEYIDHGSKRERSDTLESGQEAKRQRLSPGKTPPTETSGAAEENSNVEARSSGSPNQAETGRPERRKSSIADERQRNRRLFGALLGSLNQPRDRTAKRRQEIEDRRKAELQQQDERIAIDNQRRREQLAQQRRKKQVEVDEEYMKLRHRNALDRANFLRTKAKPHIYYRPWELTEAEEDRIDDQIRDAQEQIDEELALVTKRHDSVGRQLSRGRSASHSDKESSRSSKTPPPRREEDDRDRARTEGENYDDDVTKDQPLSTNQDIGKGEVDGRVDATGSTPQQVDDISSKAEEQAVSGKDQPTEHAEAESDDDHIVESNDDMAIF